MPRFTKAVEGQPDVVIETSLPREAAELRAQGFAEQTARTKAVKEADAEQAKTTSTK
ncbi:hypothetical protein SEA_ZUCKER_15 [Arthrobacter phage Zucker]|nr:hypothetical protein SEA_ZUCKER_15 [Arthrobacter phage Zucker]